MGMQENEEDIARREESDQRKNFVIVVLPFEMDEKSDQVEDWFLVEARWFREWSKFLQGKDDTSRPGGIPNKLLLEKNTETPKPNLEQGKHYVGMDYQAWSLLSER